MVDSNEVSIYGVTGRVLARCILYISVRIPAKIG
jgi:hypothetical protein